MNSSLPKIFVQKDPYLITVGKTSIYLLYKINDKQNYFRANNFYIILHFL